ncbi:aspartate-semialdehyde dehydrogenase [bacterium]|nr:aspartate-semialdehyde dehydrogenase [bacterium]
MSGIVVAIVGAASEVGREIPIVLGERGLELADLRLYDTTNEAEEADEGVFSVPPQSPDSIDFEGVDLAFLCGPPTEARALAECAVEGGALVVDLTAALADGDVPLVVPEVNADVVADGIGRGVYACPTPGATALAVVLKPFDEAAELRRVAVTGFEPASMAGTPGVDELARQSRELLTGASTEAVVFSHRAAFNLIPHVGDATIGGRTQAEWDIERQARQVLGHADLPLVVTCVQVPTFYGQAYSVQVETERRLDLDAARALLRRAPGVLLADDPSAPTLADVVGSDATHVGRLREDPTVPHGFVLWVVIDGLRKGGATNAVQIAELALRARG